MAGKKGRIKRFWFYGWKTMAPYWWNRIGIPLLGGDEYGRACIMWGFQFIGYIVFAYKTCMCEDCVDVRTDLIVYEQLKEEVDEEFADEVLARRLYLRKMQGERTPRV